MSLLLLSLRRIRLSSHHDRDAFQLAKEEALDSEDEQDVVSGAACVFFAAARPAENSDDSEHERAASQGAQEEAPDREDEQAMASGVAFTDGASPLATERRCHERRFSAFSQA